MSVTVRHTDGMEGTGFFQILPFFSVFKVDLVDSVQKRLSFNETLTHDVSLRILREIKGESSVKWAISHPILLLAAGCFPLFLRTMLPTQFAVMAIARVALGVIGGGLIGILLLGMLDGFITRLNSAYSCLNYEASHLIYQLENDRRLTLELPKASH